MQVLRRGDARLACNFLCWPCVGSDLRTDDLWVGLDLGGVDGVFVVLEGGGVWAVVLTDLVVLFYVVAVVVMLLLGCVR